jgi:hypothetical protein
MKKQPEKMINNLEAWMNDIFFPCVQWALENANNMITETTKVGTVNNALAYMVNVASKGQFVFAVMQGLGGNFDYKKREEFYAFVLNTSGERVVDTKNLL